MQVVLWLIGIYVALCLLAFFFSHKFMYHPDPTRVLPASVELRGVEEVELVAADGTKLVAWYAPAKAGKPTVLYFHGNAANAGNRASKIATVIADGTGVFYLNNRGYGGSAGRPSEAANVADAVAAYDRVRANGVPADKLVAYGKSLGSGQAVKLGAVRPLKAVVLEAPLASTVEVGGRTWWFLPLGLLLTDRYDNVANIGAVNAPVLILHGERDSVIPVEHGKRIFAAAREPKRLELFPEAEHWDLFDHGAWERVKAFIAGL